MSISFLYVTCSSKNEAFKIGSFLVENKYAACVNVSDHVTSIYQWQGKLEMANEYILIVKTMTHLIADIKTIIKKLHTYSVPCMVEFKAHSVNSEFAKWIQDECSENMQEVV